MEITSKFKELDNNSSPLNSPNSNNNSSTTCTTPSTPNNTSPSPIPITRSDPNSPYPTTFVTADTSSFKQVVQMLTGSSENGSCSSSSSKNFVIPPIKTGPKKQGFKLYERRNSIKNLISPLNSAAAINNFSFQNASFSPRHKPEILSPSLLDFPSLTLSPVTPLVEDPFNKSSPSIHGGSGSSSSQEDKAIAEKGFYLHPSPMSTPRDSEPQLLPLFPLSSPRVSEN
ncbi:VQ motif-containing protein 4-like [Amaranthus tricolor]|uniref:VQ motif-containing protein 4-like n=1 Tax=Amaranthus tricolor TaxID=29722 RepID=UPI00258FB01D|nr:VQ motif-containing protein 4-like [Amaranthus tricolor]